MAIVQITKALENQLLGAGKDPTDLLDDFSDWKDGYDVYQFGRDSSNGKPPFFYHVHLVPVNDPDPNKLILWNKSWSKGWSSQKRTSDRYLLYVDGGRFGFLLVALIEDPGAHLIWKTGLGILNKIAEDFEFNGSLPP